MERPWSHIGITMCGRFNIRTNLTLLHEVFDLLRSPAIEPRFNIAPTQLVLTIRADERGGRSAGWQQWGLVPSWATDPAIGSKMINARSETARTKPAFRTALDRRRCIVPASGFYEWQATGQRTKQPWHIVPQPEYGPMLAFAGLWETWTRPDGSPLETCTILTTTANATMQPLHDRMPVILPRDAWTVWLDNDGARAADVEPLLQPCPASWLTTVPISTRVNKVETDGPELIEPVELTNQETPPSGHRVEPEPSTRSRQQTLF